MAIKNKLASAHSTCHKNCFKDSRIYFGERSFQMHNSKAGELSACSASWSLRRRQNDEHVQTFRIRTSDSLFDSVKMFLGKLSFDKSERSMRWFKERYCSWACVCRENGVLKTVKTVPHAFRRPVGLQSEDRRPYYRTPTWCRSVSLSHSASVFLISCLDAK